MSRKQTMLDRIEAAHWTRQAIGTLQSYERAIENLALHPDYEQATADLDRAIEDIETAKRALRGQHTRGGTSILADLEAAQIRDPDTRPGVERRPERSA